MSKEQSSPVCELPDFSINVFAQGEKQINCETNLQVTFAKSLVCEQD